jgi:hypothetical protein
MPYERAHEQADIHSYRINHTCHIDCIKYGPFLRHTTCMHVYVHRHVFVNQHTCFFFFATFARTHHRIHKSTYALIHTWQGRIERTDVDSKRRTLRLVTWQAPSASTVAPKELLKHVMTCVEFVMKYVCSEDVLGGLLRGDAWLKQRAADVMGMLLRVAPISPAEYAAYRSVHLSQYARMAFQLHVP